MSFGFGFGFPSWRTLAGGFSPAALFVGGVQGAWYDPSDLSTMFDSSAGTTPVAMPGLGAAVPVGLMLDKSQNGVGTNGAKRVNLLEYSEQFDNAYWTKDSCTISANATTAPDGTATADKVVSAAATTQTGVGRSVTVAATQVTQSWSVKQSEVRYVQLLWSGGASTEYANFDLQTGAVTQTNAAVTPTINAQNNGFYRISLTSTWATASASMFCWAIGSGTAGRAATFAGNGVDGFFVWGADLRLASEANTQPTYQRIDANWYSTMAGNHAIAFNDSTKRPVLMARVNLLTYSEDWTNAVWTGASDRTNVTTTPNAGTNPIGGSNATRLQGTANNWFQGQTVSLTSLTPLVLSLWVKSNTGSSQTFRLFGTGTAQISSDLTATTDWQQFLFPYTPTNTAQQCGIIRNSSNSTVDLLIWGADLRPANIGANVPAYQRIADANTYDTSGFPLYLRFDGIDDSMYTPANLNLSGTDKVAVFAGVRKLVNAAQPIAELSANAQANAGAFYVFNTATANYEVFSRGSVLTGVTDSTTPTAAPSSNVVTGQFSIQDNIRNKRVNGVLVNQDSGNQGTGNYGTYPLYIGSRANSSLWLNGHLHSLIIAGSAVSAGNISATEQWVAQKAGLVIP